jgi:hypothetical protein
MLVTFKPLPMPAEESVPTLEALLALDEIAAMLISG